MADSSVIISKPTKVDQFVHLHSHVDKGSVLDGYSTVGEVVAEATRLGQPAIAITDHGSLASIYELGVETKKAGITGIAGCEFYVVPSIGTMDSRGPLFLGDGSRDDVSGRGAYTHMTILAENNTGLRNLFKLTQVASTKGYYLKPRIDLAALEEFREGLIITTGCPSGETQTLLRLGMFDRALQFVGRLVEIMGKGNVFVELMDHGMIQDLERKVKGELLEIAKRLDLPIVATNDLHYAKHENAQTHEEMLAIQTRSNMSELPDYEGGKRFAFEGQGSYYVKSAAEMAKVFPDHPEALKNTLLIAERASFQVDYDPSLRPSVPIPAGMDEDSYLRKESFDGLAKRLPHKADDPQYIARLEKELRVLKDKGFSGYFLVVSDFIRWAKFRTSPAIPMGPGRGSAAGSLIAYCLDITDADPIRFDLLFERFLNEERDSPPDIDIDVSDKDRERLIDYVRETYGEEQVAYVITFGTIGAKQAMKDIGRIYDQPFEVGNKLSKALPPPIFGKEIKLKEVYNPEADRYPEAREFRELVEEEHLQSVVEPARKLEGRVRSHGTHAAAVIISNKKLVDHIPVSLNQKNKFLQTQWDYPTAEEMGLIKMDFLGLRNLGIIQEAVTNIKNTKNIDLDVAALMQGPMDDPKVYDLLQRGDTLGVFQLDGGGLRALLKILKPTEFEDISAVLSLYRPGPMGVNAHNDFALRKNGLQDVTPIHPEFAESLKEILEPTWGLIIYQEQVQRIAQVVAGYTLAQADLLRRAMGKKKRSIIDAEFVPFQAGAKAKGYSEQAIKTLWDILVPFADYAFNKSHTVAYGIISYVTAYLKANYPSEYMAALLTSVSDSTDKTAEYLEDCRAHGIKVNVPHVNKALVSYAPLSDREIAFGFKAIRGVGEGVAQEIVQWREENGDFKSFSDFLQRGPKNAVNKRIIEGLAYGGGFDDFGLSRRAIIEGLPDVLKMLQKTKRQKAKISKDAVSLFDMLDEPEFVAAEEIFVPAIEEWSKLEKLKLEREALGLYISGHPLEGLDIPNDATKIFKLIGEEPEIPPLEGWPGRDSKPMRVAGIVTQLTNRRTKKGDSMATGVIEDLSGAIPFTVFPKAYSGDDKRGTPGVGEFLKLDGVYEFTGYSRARDGEEISFNVDTLKPLEFSEAGKLSIRVKVTEQQWEKGRATLINRLQRFRMTGSGSTNVIVSTKNSEGVIAEETLDFMVKASPILTQEIRELFGMLAIGRWRK